MATALGSILPLPEAGCEELYEIVNGERREIPRMGALAATVASFLMTHINVFALQRKLGFAVAEVMFVLRPDWPQRRPDLAFIAYDRWTFPLPVDDPPAWNVVPNLTVEVVSPKNTVDEIEDKLQDYFEAGVQLVWVVHPVRRRIYVYDSLTQVRVLTEADEIDGGSVLPGFRLKIADLYTAMLRPQ